MESLTDRLHHTLSLNPDNAGRHSKHFLNLTLSTAHPFKAAPSSPFLGEASTFGPQRGNLSISQRKARSQTCSPATFIQSGKTSEDLEIHILGLSDLPEKNQNQKRLKIKLLHQSYWHPEFKNLGKDAQLLCLIPLLRLRHQVPFSVFKTKIQPQDLKSILESPNFQTFPNAIQALFHTYFNNKPLRKPCTIPVFQGDETSLSVYPSLTSISAGLSAKNPPTCAFQSSW